MDDNLEINENEMKLILKKANDIKKQKSKEKMQKLADKKTIMENNLKQSLLKTPIIKKIDAISFLNELEDNSVDLLITDPPYSTDVSDINSFAKEWVELALKKIKQNGRAFICIGAYPKELNAYTNVLLNQNKFILDNPIIWTYKNALGITPKMKYNLNYQVILHLYSKNSSELDNGITNEMFSVMEINAPDGRLGDRYHTWQKPIILAERLIRHSSKGLNENSLIVDCFACTGTFLLAAGQQNYNAIGCDINDDNIAIAKQRGVKYE